MKPSKPSRNTRANPNRRVRVSTYLDEQNDIRSFRVEGHAGFGEYGKDIVCAAISVLADTAVNGLEQFLSIKPVYQAEDGFLECSLTQLESEQDRFAARVILGTMMLGLKQIRDVYGSKYIMIEQRRWTPC